MDSQRKTWGRELATVLLLVLVGLAFSGKTSELEILALPFVTFAIYAFGSKTFRENPQSFSMVFGRGSQTVSQEHSPEGAYEK